MVKYLLIVSVSILVGCSATGISYKDLPTSENTELAELVIFRQKQFTDGGSCYSVKIDGSEYGVLGNGGFLRKFVEPGMHEISIVHLNKKHLVITIESEAGGSNFIEYSTKLSQLSALPIGTVTNVNIGFNFAIAEVAGEYALSHLQDLRDSSTGPTCISTHSH